MNTDVECPYCGADLDINHDDGYGYDEGEKYKQKCYACGKVFAFTTTIWLLYDVEKLD